MFGTARALFENARANDVVQGGSTITQQLAKNLFLSFERSLTRKIKEAFLALLLEARFTKFEILKMYLDRAYLGGGAFGVEAASQFYFGKSVREINLSEAALLAGLFKAPTRYAPHVNLPASLARTNDVLTNLVEAGYMSPGQVHAARLNPARVIEPRQSQSPDWFLDWAFEEVQRIAEGRGHYVLTARVTVDLGHAARRAGGHGDDPALHPDAARRTVLRRARGDGARRRGARRRRRHRLRREPVQPGHARAPPAGLLLQDLRLRHRARERLQSASRSCATPRQVAATGRPGTTTAAAAPGAR